MFRPLIVGAIASAIGGGHADRDSLAWGRVDASAGAVKLVLTGGRDGAPWMTLSCQPGGGAVAISIMGRREDGAVLELHSGKTWNRYGGVGVPDGSADGAYEVRVRLSAGDPVLARFADTGELRVQLGERRLRPPNSFAQAHDLLRACGG